jgi:hypothetical protein
MRTVPAQVFLGEAGDERRTTSGTRAGEVRPPGTNTVPTRSQISRVRPFQTACFVENSAT